MKHLVRFFVIIFLILCSNNLYAESLIAFIDMNKLMNGSKAGKSISTELEKIHKKNIDYFKKKEKELKDEEASIISQKNVLSNEEFQKKITKLRDKANSYRNERSDLINSLTKKRVDATNKLITAIHPILTEYSAKNSISIVIQKKNIIIGKTELDITNDILIILNEQHKKIEIN